MKTVLKYNIPGPDSTFDAPSDARPLTAQMTPNGPAMWFLCDPDLPAVKHQVLIFGTGQLIHEAHPGNYVNTLQIREKNQNVVLHIFHKQLPLVMSS
jgi:hypothetical protein